MRTYAIGDVHGRADLLGSLLSRFRQECFSASTPYRVIFLGDIIDRGPTSREALDLVVQTLEDVPGSKLLRGNHEDIVLRFVDFPYNRDYDLMNWMCNGGVATAYSYGVEPATDWHGLQRMIPEMLHALEAHPSHLTAIRNAEHLVVDQGHIFVHAGLRPDVSLKRQSLYDLMTIRSDFLDSIYDFGLPVVHGHTVTNSRRPEIHNYRIALDTGAEETGNLTAMVLDNETITGFIRTAVSGRDSIYVEQIEPVDCRSDAFEGPSAISLIEQYRLQRS